MTWFEEFGSATRGWCAFLKQSEQIFDHSSIILSTTEPTPTTPTATTTTEPTQPAATSTLPEGDEGDAGSSFADRRLEVDDDGRLERQNSLGQLKMYCDLEILEKYSTIRGLFKHSTEVALLLLTQKPWVRFSAFPKIYVWNFSMSLGFIDGAPYS